MPLPPLNPAKLLAAAPPGAAPAAHAFALGQPGSPADRSAPAIDRARFTEGRKLITREERRRLQTVDQVSQAARQLERLPEPRETVHLVIRAKGFAPFDLLPAFIELAGQPATEVVLCSLGINDRHTEALDRLLTAGQIQRCDLLLSHYFSRVDADEYARAAAVITKHGGRVAALRSHAKLILARFAASKRPRLPARHIVCESSGNLRSCNSIEQAAIFNDAALFDFHAAWVRDLIDLADEPTPPPAPKRNP